MKKIIFIGTLMFLAANSFCQTPMDKDLDKQVKAIHKQVLKDNNDVLKNQSLTAGEKKNRIEASRSARDAKLAGVLTSEQVNAVKAKDPINWDKTLNQIDRQEKSRLTAERDQRIREVDRELRDISGQQDDIKKQMNDLKRQQKDFSEQEKVLKNKKKSIKAEYK